VAYTNAARMAWCVILDPEDENRRLMLPVKCNLTRNRTGLAYTINERGMVVWEEEPIHRDIDELLASPLASAGSLLEREAKAADWLRDTLKDKAIPSDTIIEMGKASGFSRNLVWKAKATLNIKARKESFSGGWVWEPPALVSSASVNGGPY